jgi:hypothetical protein
MVNTHSESRYGGACWLHDSWLKQLTQLQSDSQASGAAGRRGVEVQIVPPASHIVHASIDEVGALTSRIRLVVDDEDPDWSTASAQVSRLGIGKMIAG